MVLGNISSKRLNLDKTLDCGQCFRWKKLADGTWVGVIRDRVYLLKYIIFEGKECIVTSAQNQEELDIIYEYFDLNRYYDIQISSNDEFANKAYKFGEGIRILNQDPWETLVSFIISQRNSIPRIKSTIEKICKKYGTRIATEVNGRVYDGYTFPSPDRLMNVDELVALGLGYRAKYVANAAKDIYNNPSLLEELMQKEIATNEVITKLQRFNGVGLKVANCVALFGLHKLDAFPIDVWMQRIIDNYYNGSLDYSKYGDLAGLIQQYMFYYIKYREG